MSDPPKGPIETPREWLRYAEGDLCVAERELTSESPVYHTICFLCQSAVEKFLKGFLISRGWRLEKTHDIVELLGWCTEHDDKLAGTFAGGAVLNEYVVAGRYPGDISHEPIGELEAQEAIQAAQCIRKRVRYLVSRPLRDDG